jgi:VWFA-related protein
MLAHRSDAFVVWLCAAGLSALGLAVAAQTPPASPQAQAPIFRGRTTVVPIDVRVVDKNGKPVTDLKAEDFTVLENGVPQKVEFFFTQALAPAAGDAAPVRPTTAPAQTLAPANRRLFLIVLGRGRLQEPSKGVDATLRFVRERLMPQDQVAVMAWNRATDFSADKTRASEIIERFRARHEEIEHEIALYFTDLFGLYAGAEIPPHIQKLIDQVFDSPGAAGRHVVPTGRTQAAEDDAQRALNSVLNGNTLETFRLFGGTDALMASGMFDPTLEMSFADYIVLNRQTMQDVGNLYAGIDYLRFIPGEKHLIFVTEQGFYLPRADYDRDLAVFASDARVALDTIQTGGVAATMAAGGPMGPYITVQNGPQLRALREISDISGGQSSVSKYAEAAFDRILSSTEFGYLLGYVPSDPRADGRTRNIKVTVNRRDATVAYRRAYVARPDNASFDPRESLAATRLMSAVNYEREVPDLSFTTRLLDVKEGAIHFVNVEVTLDAKRLQLAAAGDRYVAALNFAILCGDYYQKEIGQLWEAKDVFVPADRMDEIQRSGLTVTLRVPVRQPPVFVKIVVYDYGSDRLGSAIKVMK